MFTNNVKDAELYLQKWECYVQVFSSINEHTLNDRNAPLKFKDILN